MISSRTKLMLVRMVRSILKPQKTSSKDHILEKTRDAVIVRSKRDADARRIGVYLRGGCDVPALFSMAGPLTESFRGTCAIQRDPIAASGSRSDLLLQALDGLGEVPTEALEGVTKLLGLPPRYFKADIFDPTFLVRTGVSTREEFRKDVVVLSTAPDYSRSLYRHREHGFLVDPGGYWLGTSVSDAMADMSVVETFNREFVKVGRMTLETFRASFGRLVREMRDRTGAHIVALNVLTVDPSDPTHSYRLVKNHDTARRREFSIALAELSHELGFDVLDIDRILKRRGIQGQVDFAHFSDQQFEPIGRAGYGILQERGVF